MRAFFLPLLPAMLEMLRFVDATSWALLLAMLCSLGLAALAGKFSWGRAASRDAAAEDDLKIVLGATLSLFGLLMGFTLSFAISGYNTRMSAEENEAIAIGNAFQWTAALDAGHQPQAQAMLQDYLSLRIRFFDTVDEGQRAQVRMESIRLQTRMWQLISKVAKASGDPQLGSALGASNALYVAQQKTMASWRRQIPGAAWAILMAFGLCSNFLIGYNSRGRPGGRALIFMVPVVTALTLFMIAEIDVPGKGIIHVVPDNLQAVRVTVENGGLAP